MEKPSSLVVEEELIQNLPKTTDSVSGVTFCLYQGFWVPEFIIRGVFALQKRFVARDDDILLASCPKSGTTWLKALSFSIANRRRFAGDLSDSPLLSSSPHDLVPNLEFDVYDEKQSIVADAETLARPRLVCTHVAYDSLPVSAKSSNCKIVYVWRNPMDQAVSLFHFLRAFNDIETSGTGEEFFASFCRGVHLFGPFWDHVLGFWRASLESPEKILFLKYEDLKNDASLQVKKLAGFLGFPFSEEEEREGVVEKICDFCSIERMKSFKGNIEGVRLSGASNSSYFRKGQVGDWVNLLSPSMADTMQKIIRQKFGGSGLIF